MEESKRIRKENREEDYCYGNDYSPPYSPDKEPELESYLVSDNKQPEEAQFDVVGPLLRDEDVGAQCSSGTDEDYAGDAVEEVPADAEVEEPSLLQSPMLSNSASFDSPCRLPSVLTDDRISFDMAIIMVEENESHRVMKRFIDNLNQVCKNIIIRV